MSEPAADQSDRGWILLGAGMALVALCVTVFGWIVGLKFEAVFADLGIRVPLITEWATDGRFHALATAPLIAASAYTAIARSFLPFLLITGIYIAVVVVALFLPLVTVVGALGAPR